MIDWYKWTSSTTQRVQCGVLCWRDAVSYSSYKVSITVVVEMYAANITHQPSSYFLYT
jgi:hypothetical protein